MMTPITTAGEITGIPFGVDGAGRIPDTALPRARVRIQAMCIGLAMSAGIRTGRRW
jgi:hypothetical protein